MGDPGRVRLHQRRRGTRRRDGREGVDLACRSRFDADRDAACARGRRLPPRARVVRKSSCRRYARRGRNPLLRRDPRIDEYARLLVERSLGVQAGWQVAIRANHLGWPLIEAVIEQIARKGGYPILQLQFEQVGGPFAREAPLELLREPAPLQKQIWETVDGMISIYCPEDVRE